VRGFLHHLHEKREWVLWGLPRGKRDRIHERILYTQAKSEADLERVKRLAAQDGWHSFRVQTLDLSKPFDAGAAFGRAVREGTEHGDTPQPQSKYFRQPFSIGGKIVQLYPVFEVPVKDKKYMRTRYSIGEREGSSPYVDSPGQKAYDAKMSVWRWRVRIQTDEGWMLMGFIGNTKRKEDLPPIRAGDTVELKDLQLSARTGGNRYVEGGYYFARGGIDRASEKALDYRSNRYDRQLHGKVKRKSV
jgi:hypothetical protein